MIKRALLAGCLIASSVSAQDAVRHALALSDAQILQLEELNRRPSWEVTRLREAVLDDRQRATLASIRKVLYGDVAHLAARLGLIDQKDWERRFGQTCLFGEIRQYIYYTKQYSGTPLELYLSPAQAEQFEKLERERDTPIWAQIRAKDIERDALLNSGSTKDSPAVVQLGLATNQLSAHLNDPLPLGVVMSILDSDQKAKLAGFESELQVAAEAVQLGLIERAGEILCH